MVKVGQASSGCDLLKQKRNNKLSYHYNRASQHLNDLSCELLIRYRFGHKVSKCEYHNEDDDRPCWAHRSNS